MVCARFFLKRAPRARLLQRLWNACHWRADSAGCRRRARGSSLHARRARAAHSLLQRHCYYYHAQM